MFCISGIRRERKNVPNYMRDDWNTRILGIQFLIESPYPTMGTCLRLLSSSIPCCRGEPSFVVAEAELRVHRRGGGGVHFSGASWGSGCVSKRCDRRDFNRTKPAGESVCASV